MIKTLFTDLGGVILTNGWDRSARARAAVKFGLDAEDCDERHHLTFDTYEIGKLSLEQYLERVVFHTSRDFGFEEFRDFMFEQSKPLPEMSDMVRQMKAWHGLQVAAISNEGPELAQHRIDSFHLREFIDAFFISGFLGARKPDEAIFRTALMAMQASVDECVYIDDRKLFVEVATGLGLNAIHHTSVETTRKALVALGLDAE